MDQEVAQYMNTEELRQYTESIVKKLIVQMYDRYIAGKFVCDYGGVQYKYLEYWGMIELDAYIDFKNKAVQIDQMSINSLLGRGSDLQTTIDSAKMLCVKDYFQRVKESGKPITYYLG